MGTPLAPLASIRIVAHGDPTTFLLSYPALTGVVVFAGRDGHPIESVAMPSLHVVDGRGRSILLTGLAAILSALSARSDG
ncbi:hypothetical protein CQ037_09825 [Microbacterium sp. MYb50]|nr:hypothetical protein CQ032_07265 [Microbacterium sp. MYb43]PRB28377.1 hypothetical protein CQ037_09825 [Microbacterium sp. MYb50]